MAFGPHETLGDLTGNTKLRTLLRTFLDLDNGMRITAVWRAVCFSALFIALSVFLFLLQATPHSADLWFTTSIMIMPIFIILVPLAWVVHFRLRRRRNSAARGFFAQGMRVDEHGRLVTNSAHPKVAVDLAVPAPSLTL